METNLATWGKVRKDQGGGFRMWYAMSAQGRGREPKALEELGAMGRDLIE